MTHLLQQLDFSNQVALIFGASRGIGLATAKTLSSYGATVVLAARNADTLNFAKDAILRKGGVAHSVVCDVANYSSVERVAQEAVEKFGRIDLLINNAGVIEPLNHLIDSDPMLWGRTADINYKGTYHGMRAVIPLMLRNGGGIVVNMSSGAANSALEGWSHYCSTKAATKKLTEVAHVELGQRGIRVVGLSPGTVATDMMATIKESGINVVSTLDWDSHIPPEWAAEAVAFLCGPEGEEFAGTDFSIKTEEGRIRVGLLKEKMD